MGREFTEDSPNAELSGTFEGQLSRMVVQLAEAVYDADTNRMTYRVAQSPSQAALARATAGLVFADCRLFVDNL